MSKINHIKINGVTYDLTQVLDFNIVATDGNWSDWNDTLGYTQTIDVEGVLETDKPFVDVDMSNPSITPQNLEPILDAWSYVNRVEVLDNQVRLYCLSQGYQPKYDIPIVLRVIR